LEEFNFAYEISEIEHEEIEVSVFNHDLPPYDNKLPPEMSELLKDHDISFGESKFQVWFSIGKDNFIQWWDDESPDDYPLDEHEHDPSHPYLSLRIESSAADERRSLIVTQIKVPLTFDPDEDDDFCTEEDYRYQLENGEFLEVHATFDPSVNPPECYIELTYKKFSVSQRGRSGLYVSLSAYPDIVVIARMGDVE